MAEDLCQKWIIKELYEDGKARINFQTLSNPAGFQVKFLVSIYILYKYNNWYMNVFTLYTKILYTGPNHMLPLSIYNEHHPNLFFQKI